MLKLWIERESPTPWLTLVEALGSKVINRMDIVDDIEDKHRHKLNVEKESRSIEPKGTPSLILFEM